MSAFRRILVVGLIAAFASASSCAPRNIREVGQHEVVISASSGEYRFKIEIADTDEERALGLMHRTEMADNAGMLFDYSDDVREISMWMKNTLIPLDMAFIASDGRIVRIAADTTPRSLTSIRSGATVAAVLEVKGGRFAALGVREGDIVHHPLFGTY